MSETTEHVNGEGDAKHEPGEHYAKFIEAGMIESVARKLDDIYKAENLKDDKELDERAVAALIDFQQDETAALDVVEQFRETSLQHVLNPSSFLCGLMKAYRAQRSSEKKGPDAAKLKLIQELIEKTGYSLDVTTGQRKYGGPPPDWEGPHQPGAGHEVFCGRLPKDIYEDELVPLFEKFGRIWDLRIMMDPCYGVNKGYCFVTFCDREAATNAVTELNNYEIRPDKRLRCNISIANTRLFVGNIPKGRNKHEIKEEFAKHVEGITDVIIYGSADEIDKIKNRGFAFLQFDCHKSASNARRKLFQSGKKVWHCDIIVDWADPQEEPDEETMSKVKVLYVRNLTSDVTEADLVEKFGEHGKVERCKKMKDYAFVHFELREKALEALEALNGAVIGKLNIDVSLAKPQTESAQKKKEIRRKEQEKMRMMGYGGPVRGPFGRPDFNMDRGGARGGWGGRGGRGGGGPGGFDDYGGYYYDYGWDYGYGEPYRSGYPDPYLQGFDDYDESGYAYYGYSGFGPSPRGRGAGGMRGGPKGLGGRGGGGMRGGMMGGPRGAMGGPGGGRMMTAARGRAGMPAKSPSRGGNNNGVRGARGGNQSPAPRGAGSD